MTAARTRLATALEVGAGLAVALVPALTGARGVSLGPWWAAAGAGASADPSD